jgi:hypothetical protein
MQVGDLSLTGGLVGVRFSVQHGRRGAVVIERHGSVTVEIVKKHWGRLGDDGKISLLMHELGHLMGLGHDDRPGHIMNSVLQIGAQSVSIEDIERIKNSYGKKKRAA